MLQNARLTAFTVSELLRENQKGAEEISEHEQCQFWIQSSMLSSRNSHRRRQGKQLLKGILQNGCQNFADKNC